MLCPEREVRNDGIKTGKSYPYGIDPSEKKADHGNPRT